MDGPRRETSRRRRYAAALLIYNVPGLDSGARWRSLLAIGAVPFVAALALLRTLSEREREDDAAKATDLSEWAKDREVVLGCVGASLCWFGYNTYAYGIMTYYPELVAEIVGENTQRVLLAALAAGGVQLIAAIGSVEHIRHVGSANCFSVASCGAATFCTCLLFYYVLEGISAWLLVLFILLRGFAQWPGIAVLPPRGYAANGSR